MTEIDAGNPATTATPSLPVNPTLSLLFEGLRDGLIWSSASGQIKFANTRAVELCGLKAGQDLPEGRLRKAVQVIAAGKLDNPLEMEFEPPPGARPLLHARVMAALTPGDAFVFLSPPALYGEPLALANLMTVIRTELGGQLKRLENSLDAARQGADVGRLGEAIEQSKAVTDTLARLTDLSAIWASESLLADDRIEAWKLLQEVWEQARPFAESRKVSVRMISRMEATTSPIIYGSEFWIRRVMVESLQSALRAAGNGATLDIEMRQMGPRVLVVFRNSGMWAAQARGAVILNDAAARPDASKPAPPRPSVDPKDLIGLALCERILALHGGQLREEVDDGLRNFLIDLPTGAPHRAEFDATLDSAQAQRYAADLSALMARGRRPRP